MAAGCLSLVKRPVMTCDVFGGTLYLTQAGAQSLKLAVGLR